MSLALTKDDLNMDYFIQSFERRKAWFFSLAASMNQMKKVTMIRMLTWPDIEHSVKTITIKNLDYTLAGLYTSSAIVVVIGT